MKRNSVGKGVYRDDAGRLWHRPVRDNGKRTWILLRARTPGEAAKEALKRGIAPSVLTFRDLAVRWQEQGCPDKGGMARTPDYVTRAGQCLRSPISFFGHLAASDIQPPALIDYARFRKSNLARAGTGNRTVDLELAACSSLYGWAVFCGLVPANPFFSRPRWQKSSLVSHSTERAPASGDQLHRIAAALLDDRRSQSCGFLFLFLAMTGCRTADLRSLRLDEPVVGQAKPPGWCSGTELVIRRSKTKGDRALQVIAFSPEARELYRAWHAWHSSAYPHSPYWFPGRSGAEPLDKASLAHSLARVCRDLSLPVVSPHGCRSFFATALRRIEPDDRIVAARMGHTDVAMVQRIYSTRMDSATAQFLPESGSPPAWAKFLPVEAANVVPMSA